MAVFSGALLFLSYTLSSSPKKKASWPRRKIPFPKQNPNKKTATMSAVPNQFHPSTEMQEDPLAPLALPEAPPPQAATGGRQRRGHHQPGTEQAGGDAQGSREVEGRDAAGGGDAAQGQVHHLRPQGEEVPQRNTQYAVAKHTYTKDHHHQSALPAAKANAARKTSLSEVPKWTRVSQRVNPPGF